jgi:hypothetical protein
MDCSPTQCRRELRCCPCAPQSATLFLSRLASTADLCPHHGIRANVIDESRSFHDVEPKSRLTVPKAGLTLHEVGLALHKVSLTLPKAHPAVPKVRLALPEARLAVPEVSLTLPEARLAAPEVSLALPEARLTLPKARFTLPKANPALPKGNRALRGATISYAKSCLAGCPAPARFAVPNRGTQPLGIAHSLVIRIWLLVIPEFPSSNLSHAYTGEGPEAQVWRPDIGHPRRSSHRRR